jgi:hypothetical protein
MVGHDVVRGVRRRRFQANIQDFQCCLTIKSHCEITRALTDGDPMGQCPLDRPQGVPRRGLQLGHYASIWRHIFAIFVSRAAEHCDLLLALGDAGILRDDPHATGIGFGLAAHATALGLNVGLSRGSPRCRNANKCRQNAGKDRKRQTLHLHDRPHTIWSSSSSHQSASGYAPKSPCPGAWQ